MLPAPIEDPGGRRRPPGRYDQRSRAASRSLAVVLSVLFVAFLVSLSWLLYQRSGGEQVPLQLRGYELVGDDVVVVEFDVTPPADGTAWCLVRARQASGEEIGAEHVPVLPRPDGGAVRVRHELTVRGEAVTGEVPRCRPVPPPAGEPTAEPVSP
ncbi:MAG TPA: DUF4307 domain-containing protein [Mycobacteriales bacterium]|nr:DUF4307 domain-containing protein [Mycobacteriales bacterium]